MRRPTLVVMLKEPRAGRVKTRLGRDIGMTRAAWWFRHQTAKLLRTVNDPRWDVWLAVAPDDAIATTAWPRRFPRLAQGRGDLGKRMIRAMHAAAPGPAVVIGGDIPGVRPLHIWRALRALGQNDVVFGPATDGGYWLFGLRNPLAIPVNRLSDVRWSNANTLADSVAAFSGAKIGLVDKLRDVDRAADLSA